MIRLHIVLLVGICVLSVSLFSGCKKKTDSTLPSANSQAGESAPTTTAKSALARTFDRARLPSLMKQVAIAYHSYWSSFNKGPANVKELAPMYENNPQVTKLIDSGPVVVFWGATLQGMTEGTSNTVLAYEKEADRGQRYVLMADGSVKTMSQQEFDKAPKAGK